MPSKHFCRCGCTLDGSFVSDRISSISSFDRKKKRGNARRLSSRYAASPCVFVFFRFRLFRCKTYALLAVGGVRDLWI